MDNKRADEIEQGLMELQQRYGTLDLLDEPPEEEVGMYRKLFGEGILNNIDSFYNLKPKKTWMMDTLKGLVPKLGEKQDYISPGTDPTDRKWLNRFLEEGTP